MAQLSNCITPLITFTCWSIVYVLLCLLDKKRDFIWHAHTVRFAHAIVILMLSAYSVFVQGPWPFTHSGGDNTEFQQFVLVVSLGYFILDALFSLLEKQDHVMHIHHTVCVFFIAAGYFTGRIGTGLMMMLFLAEITNPLLHLRWFLRAAKKTSSFRLIIELLFVVLFTVARIIVMPYFMYSYYQQDTDLLGRVGATVLVSVGFAFWIQIMKICFYKYKSLHNNRSNT